MPQREEDETKCAVIGENLFRTFVRLLPAGPAPTTITSKSVCMGAVIMCVILLIVDQIFLSVLVEF